MPNATGRSPADLNLDVFVEHQPAEQHAERRHQEMIGAGGRRAEYLQQMEPQQKAMIDPEHERSQGRQKTRALGTMSATSATSTRTAAAQSGGHILDAIADPQAALWLQYLEQDGASNDRHQRSQREQDAVPIIRADRQRCQTISRRRRRRAAAPRPCARSALAEKHRGQHRGEDRVGADDSPPRPAEMVFRPV